MVLGGIGRLRFPQMKSILETVRGSITIYELLTSSNSAGGQVFKDSHVMSKLL